MIAYAPSECSDLRLCRCACENRRRTVQTSTMEARTRIVYGTPGGGILSSLYLPQFHPHTVLHQNVCCVDATNKPHSKYLHQNMSSLYLQHSPPHVLLHQNKRSVERKTNPTVHTPTLKYSHSPPHNQFSSNTFYTKTLSPPQHSTPFRFDTLYASLRAHFFTPLSPYY